MKKETESVKAPAFTKAELRGAKRYRDKRDLIEALLADDKAYTFEEVDAIIDKFLKEVI